jgi:putative oxidoreductase
MQRLFTTFPNGWPGTGLLLLRVACAFPLVLDGLSILWSGAETGAIWLPLVGLLPAVLLLLGLYTPVAALLQVLVELSLTLATPSLTGLHLTRAAIGVALMSLGPGARSLDSRIYGRKRIEL